jgi:hypothetical protein
MSLRNIVCMKWGTKYGPEYVNRLYAMVKRHVAGEFNFICLTDDASGIVPQVSCMPIPTMKLPEGIPERGWNKLASLSSDFGGLEGNALFLDIDVVIVDSIEPFFEYPGEFLIIHDYKRPWRITGNSSVYRFKIRAHKDVLAYFEANTGAVRESFRNEQAFLTDYLHQQGKVSYWPAAWCPSFKYHSIPRWPTNYWLEPTIPEGARIIIFHGECNPPDALAGRRNRRFRYIKPTSYVAQHWRE